jgi:hypothetical protein
MSSDEETGLLRLDEGVGFLRQLQKLKVDGCPALRQPPREIVAMGPHALHDYCSRVRASFSTGILDLTGVPIKRLPAAALSPDTLHTLLLVDTLIEVLPSSDMSLHS